MIAGCRDKVDKPRNCYQNHLFRPEGSSPGASTSTSRVAEVREPADAQPRPSEECEGHGHEAGGHIDKEIKQRCHIIQMTYFKSYVQVSMTIAR